VDIFTLKKYAKIIWEVKKGRYNKYMRQTRKTRINRRGRPLKPKTAKACKIASAYFTQDEIRKLKALVGERQQTISAYLRDLVMPTIKGDDNLKTG